MIKPMIIAAVSLLGIAACTEPAPLVCGSEEHIAAQDRENSRVEQLTAKDGTIIYGGEMPLIVPCVGEPVPPVTVPPVTPPVTPPTCTENCGPVTPPVCTEDCGPDRPNRGGGMPITAADIAEDMSGKERDKDVGTNYDTETDNRHDNSVKEDTDTENNNRGDDDDAVDGNTSTPPNDNPRSAFNR